MDESDLKDLRIRQIGQYYTVRIGRFMDYREADEFLLRNASNLPGGIILKIYIKD